MAAEAEWFMDYRNADGHSPRCAATASACSPATCCEHGLAAGPSFAVATRSGIARCWWNRTARSPWRWARPASWPGTGRDRRRESGTACGSASATRTLACLVDEALDKFDLTAPPGWIRRDFPDGVQRRTGPADRAGQRSACGCTSGARARRAPVVRARSRLRQQQPLSFSATKTDPRRWHVTVPGRELLVTLEAGTSWLTGPAVIVAEGELDPDWLTGR